MLKVVYSNSTGKCPICGQSVPITTSNQEGGLGYRSKPTTVLPIVGGDPITWGPDIVTGKFANPVLGSVQSSSVKPTTVSAQKVAASIAPIPKTVGLRRISIRR